MFAKLTIFTVATFAIFASAAPTGESTSQCNTGEMHCCNSTFEQTSEYGQAITGIIGAGVGGVGTLIGANCSPLTAVGLAGNSCNAQAVCCKGNNFNGLIAMGCSPIHAGL